MIGTYYTAFLMEGKERFSENRFFRVAFPASAVFL